MAANFNFRAVTFHLVDLILSIDALRVARSGERREHEGTVYFLAFLFPFFSFSLRADHDRYRPDMHRDQVL